MNMMLRLGLVLSLLSIASAHGHSFRLANASDPLSTENYIPCGTHSMDAITIEQYKDAVKDAEVSFGMRGRTVDNLNEDVHVPIVFTVIHSTDGSGKVQREALIRQTEVLSKAYAIAKIQFHFHQARYISNDVWFTECDRDKVAKTIRSQVVQNPKFFLNIIVCYPEKDVLGWSSSFPHEAPEHSLSHAIFLNYKTIPDVSRGPFSLGHTAVHEVGHFFGLLHTFNSDNTCDEDGDGIEDTPIESSPAFGCPIDRDSCPGKPGLDPISNYMDYSFDSCMSHFTPLQSKRMRYMISKFKPTLLLNSDSNAPSLLSQFLGDGLTLRDYLSHTTKSNDWKDILTDSLETFGECKSWILQIKTDMYPKEVAWALTYKANDWDTAHMIASGKCNSQRTYCGKQFKLCRAGLYALNVTDAGNDGFCCSHGKGWWGLAHVDDDNNGNMHRAHVSNAIFKSHETFAFRISNAQRIPVFRSKISEPASIEPEEECKCKAKKEKSWAESMMCTLFSFNCDRKDKCPC